MKRKGRVVHLDEHTIELYVIGAEAVKPRRKEIARHLRQCKGCSALHAEIAEYYSQVVTLQRDQSTRDAQALSVPERVIQRRSAEETAPVAPFSRTLPQRFVESFRHYPLQWSAGFVLAAALVALMVPRLVVGDLNPATARPEDGSLVVYNKEGGELWKKAIGVGFDYREPPEWQTLRNSYGYAVVDVDRDGRNEVLGAFGWAPWLDEHNKPFSNSIFCFQPDGSVKWRYDVHRQVTLGGVSFSDDYIVYQTQAGDFDRDGNYEIIGFVQHDPWFPNVMVKLDARDGKLISEYWHNGMFKSNLHRDIDGDGVEELFWGGQNNRLSQASLAVMDPRAADGHGPAPPEYRPDGISPGREKFYLLFPASDLKPYWNDITNEVFGMSWKEDSTVEVVVLEKMNLVLKDTAGENTYDGGAIYYYFDTSMKCVRVRVSDGFSAIRARHRYLKMVKGEIDSVYLENLRQGVRYWDGEKFVSEPVMNRRYLEWKQSVGAGER